MRIFHLSDIHFGLVDEAALEWVRESIALERPDAVAITGDLTMREDPCSRCQQQTVVWEAMVRSAASGQIIRQASRISF